MSGIDYRHVEYMPHGHTPDHASQPTCHVKKEIPAGLVSVTASLQEAQEPSVTAPLSCSQNNTLSPILPPLPLYTENSGGSATTDATPTSRVPVIPISNSSNSLTLQVPRPIPASTAIKMIRTFIETLMFLRGQLPTTWQMLQRTLNYERKKMNHQQPVGMVNCHPESQPSANVALIRKLEAFLGPAEEMFEALGDTVMREIRQRAQVRSTEMLVISVAFILGSTLSTPKELYRIHVGPIQPSFHFSPSSPSPTSLSILQPATPAFQKGYSHDDEVLLREENEWVRRLAQLMVTNGYDYTNAILPRMRAHLILKASPGMEDDEGRLLPRQTLVLPGDDQYQGPHSYTATTAAFSTTNTATSHTSHSSPPCHQQHEASMPPPPCPSTVRYPVYTCHITGPSTYQPAHDPKLMFTADRTTSTSGTSIWYQAGPSLPIPPNFD